MNKKILTLLFVLSFVNFYAQINFEKSYFIDNKGDKIECFIKNKDKNDNPINFEYKLNLDNSEVLLGDINNVNEFKIGDILKFQRANVKLDTSSVNLQRLKGNREPEWKTVTVFLKTLVDSETSLFEYKNGNIWVFFYKKGNSAIEQLIYKKYIVEEDLISRLTYNNDFQKQLWENVNCDNKSVDSFLQLKYKRKDLINYFTEYNTCKNNTIVDFGDKLEKGSINVKILAGFTSSSLSISNSYANTNPEFDKKINFTFGGEFEWILPINRNKWSLYSSLSYNSYTNSTSEIVKDAGPFSSDSVIQYWDASLSHLDVAIGFKYYMFLNANSKIFIEGSYIGMQPMNSDIHNDNGAYQVEANFSNGFAYGMGYCFKNKLSIELKNRGLNVLRNYYFFDSKYNSTSLVLGYAIFDSKNKK